MKKRVIIIGGGYGGLATANLFAKAGYDVTVLEKNHQLGGRTGEQRQDGFRFDTGPSWYLMPEVFAQYYELLGYDAERELELIRLQPGYKVFFESYEPLTIAGNLAHDAATFEKIEPGAGEKLQRYVAHSQKIYDLSVQHILYNTYKSFRSLLSWQLMRAGIRYSTLALQTLDHYVSRRFQDQRLRQILEYHSVFLGSSPFEAPAIFSLMSNLDFNSGVYYPKRGMYRLVENMVTIGESLGVHYETNAPVAEIVVRDDTACGVRLADGRELPADIVISNADLHFTETQLLKPEHQTYPETYWQKRQPGPSALLVSLGVRGKLPQLEHHNLYFVDDWRENFEAIYGSHTVPDNASIYICKPSHSDETAAPKGDENIFMLVPLPADVVLSDKEIAKLTNHCVTLLGTLADAPDIAGRIVTKHITSPRDFDTDFHSWAYNALGGESHLLRQSAMFRTRNQSKKVHNLYYVGASTNPGIGLPMCLMSAQLVYKLVHDIPGGEPLRPGDLEDVS